MIYIYLEEPYRRTVVMDKEYNNIETILPQNSEEIRRLYFEIDRVFRDHDFACNADYHTIQVYSSRHFAIISVLKTLNRVGVLNENIND